MSSVSGWQKRTSKCQCLFWYRYPGMTSYLQASMPSWFWKLLGKPVLHCTIFRVQVITTFFPMKNFHLGHHKFSPHQTQRTHLFHNFPCSVCCPSHQLGMMAFVIRFNSFRWYRSLLSLTLNGMHVDKTVFNIKIFRSCLFSLLSDKWWRLSRTVCYSPASLPTLWTIYEAQEHKRQYVMGARGFAVSSETPPSPLWRLLTCSWAWSDDWW